MDKFRKPMKRLAAWMMAMIVLIGAATWFAGMRARSTLLRENPAPGQLVDVGGFKMHIHCMGEGSPTVILVSGLDDFSIAWSRVQPEIARTTRVCTYDRAGLGWSELSTNPSTSLVMVEELHALLVNAGVAGPYLMVGHSFGGALAELYVHLYPDEILGLVLVDAAPAKLFDRVPAWRKAIEQKLEFYRTLAPLSSFGLLALAPDNIPNRGFNEQALAQYRAISVATSYYQTCIAENERFETNLAEIKAMDIPDYGNLPLIVISRGRWDPMPGLSPRENTEARQAWSEMQDALLSHSANSKHVIADGSEHNIQLDQPELVIEAVRELIN